MLTEKQIKEIREHLENAKNPIFLFDNDPDGLCSFLLLQRYIGCGKGVAIKSMPGLDKNYFRKVEEFNSDYIFVVDKPLIDKEFIELAEKAGIPLVHIDHHNVPKPDIKCYYNPYFNDKTNEPVSYLCYKITGRKEDMWLAAIGCITDSYVPDFMKEFKEKNPDLIDSSYKNAFDILYKTRLGKASMIISFAMKDKTSNVVAMMKFLLNSNSANDLLEENSKTKVFLKRFEHINERYQDLLKKAEAKIDSEVLFFTYAGDLSISQYVANELFYKYPEKIIIIVYKNGNIANLSLRWNNDIRTATVNAVKDIEGASGGGHTNATGARMPADKLDTFKENLLKEIEKIKGSKIN